MSKRVKVKRKPILNRNTMPRGKRTNLGNAGALLSDDRSRKRIYHQCVSCGAPVNPAFGNGQNSWCPFCNEKGCVLSTEGQLPDPALYGQWRRDHQSGSGTVQNKVTDSSNSNPVQGETDMKQMKSHTGTYSCLNCCTEFELVGETHLKCDECGGPLFKGTLDEWADDDPSDEDEIA